MWCPQPLRAMLLHRWVGAIDRLPRGPARRRTCAGSTGSGSRCTTCDSRSVAGDPWPRPTTSSTKSVCMSWRRTRRSRDLTTRRTRDSRAPGRGRRDTAGRPGPRRLAIRRPCRRPTRSRPKLRRLLGGCDFGRPLHRVDVTVTSERRPRPSTSARTTSPSASSDGAFVEELLYRNLHPMIAKRLDLWRLSNFSLRAVARPSRTCTCSAASRTTTRSMCGCSRSPRCAT